MSAATRLRRAAVLLALAAALGLALSGCGRKAFPDPPDPSDFPRQMPKPI